ncbi:MAG: type II secretion system protein [Phycisphaerales bacterium]|jgi:prepilin-type N-terminal cleavage/methylation domain-containing protein/prepilin-type processing-associated H-X9-DG protein
MKEKGHMEELKCKELSKQTRRAFTLVELLVVISIIALLLGILMPSLSKARQASYAIKCAANIKNAGVAMDAYVAKSNGYYPASYLYCLERGKPHWRIDSQSSSYQANGYIHWSHHLFSGGQCNKEAFECPAIRHKGIPRTNPGANIEDWEDGQLDMQGSPGPNPNLQDFQAARMALAGNGAIIIRNKFRESYSSNFRRFNRFVNSAQIKGPGRVILATEFNKNWKAIAKGGSSHHSSGVTVKSHRPITAFHSQDQGADVYRADPYLGFRYGDTGRTFGIISIDSVNNSAIEKVPLNAVGRHHSGTYKGSIKTGMTKRQLGGTANFLYCDGHIERKHVLETVENAEWGKRFYGITGKNSVLKP